MSQTETENTDSPESHRAPSVPGLVLVYRGATPCCQVLPLARGVLTLGRESTAALVGGDRRMSRAHTEVRVEGGRWSVRDLGSRNGTFLDGSEVRAPVDARPGAVLRLAESIFLLAADVRPFQNGVTDDDFVVGPAMRACLTRLEQAAAAGRDVLVTGETGSGKEIAARVFHGAGSRAALPMIGINCATIPEGLAERLLFGARRGAYSGANADVVGYFGEGDGRVLFLDEVGELDVRVQAKLLRFLETREITPLGATQSQRVDVQICFATHRDLSTAVAEGGMREDFYYRMSTPAVALPALRERLEEIPWLVARELRADTHRLTAHPKFVEACMLRPWRGNVRELLHAVRSAAERAATDGAPLVRAEHLGDDARAGAPVAAPPPPRAARPRHTKEEIDASIAQHGGNLAATAEALGIHRRQLYRLLERHGIARGRT